MVRPLCASGAEERGQGGHVEIARKPIDLHSGFRRSPSDNYYVGQTYVGPRWGTQKNYVRERIEATKGKQLVLNNWQIHHAGENDRGCGVGRTLFYAEQRHRIARKASEPTKIRPTWCSQDEVDTFTGPRFLPILGRRVRHLALRFFDLIDAGYQEIARDMALSRQVSDKPSQSCLVVAGKDLKARRCNKAPNIRAEDNRTALHAAKGLRFLLPYEASLI